MELKNTADLIGKVIKLYDLSILFPQIDHSEDDIYYEIIAIKSILPIFFVLTVKSLKTGLEFKIISTDLVDSYYEICEKKEVDISFNELLYQIQNDLRKLNENFNLLIQKITKN